MEIWLRLLTVGTLQTLANLFQFAAILSCLKYYTLFVKLRNTVFFIVLAAALAAVTLSLTSTLFNDLNVWLASLTKEQKKLLPPIFATVTGVFVCLGAFLWRDRNISDEEL